jgi:hypothetical protein
VVRSKSFSLVGDVSIVSERNISKIICVINKARNFLFERSTCSVFLWDLAKIKNSFLCFYHRLRTIDLGADRSIFLKIHDPKVHVARAPDRQSNAPRIYSNKNLSFSNKNLRYGLELMCGVVVNGIRGKQVFILAKVGFVSNINGCEKLHYGFRFSKKIDTNR